MNKADFKKCLAELVEEYIEWCNEKNAKSLRENPKLVEAPVTMYYVWERPGRFRQVAKKKGGFR